jgi:hypothetical protein
MNCVLFYGSNLMPLQKHGGVFRIASELRKHGYSSMCIDICTFAHINKIDQLKEVLSNIISDNTLWVGFSTTFFDKVFISLYQNIKNKIKINKFFNIKKETTFDESYDEVFDVLMELILTKLK